MNTRITHSTDRPRWRSIRWTILRNVLLGLMTCCTGFAATGTAAYATVYDHLAYQGNDISSAAVAPVVWNNQPHVFYQANGELDQVYYNGTTWTAQSSLG